MNPPFSAFRTLVVGYGNELRGDDCAGRRVAEIIADQARGTVEVRSVHQLTPDLAPLIAEVDLAIFADATVDKLVDEIRVRELTPITPKMDGAHAGSAPELLGLAQWLYGSCPQAFAVDITAVSFELSLNPSKRTVSAIARAVSAINELILSKAGCARA